MCSPSSDPAGATCIIWLLVVHSNLRRCRPSRSCGQRAHSKLPWWKFTSGACGCVCVCGWGSVPPPPPLFQQHSHISSSVLQRQGASAQVGRPGSICCYYFPLIIGLNNGMSVSPSPLKPYTLFIFQRSRFCSAFSPSTVTPPSPFSLPPDPFERASHENDIFDWPHQYVTLSIWRHSPHFMEAQLSLFVTGMGLHFAPGVSHLKRISTSPMKQRR